MLLATLVGDPLDSLGAFNIIIVSHQSLTHYHSRFIHQLQCRNVNFVSGQNGSGKSAILAAIQICLGAGARRTNRARNLKELVRKEASAGNAPAQAKIRVTLLNEGEDGYKHEEYGDSITVERTISLGSGYNGYKLLNHAGKEVSRNKKDLDDMLDLLNIQVENPVAVLDQEEAKKFLTGKAEDKYNFFMKATELERVDRTYATTMDQVHDLHNNKEKIKDSLNQSMRQVDTLKKKWEQHQALETLQNKLAEFKVKCAWSCHDAAADLFAASEEDMEKFQTKANKKQVELSQAEESANDPAEDETAKRDHMNELVTEAREQTDLKRNLEAELKKAILPYKTLERQLNNLGRQQQSANAELAASKMRLQELRDTIMANSGSAESEEARRTELLRETEIELEQARTEVNELRQATSVALRSYEELEPHVAEARSKVQSAERQVQAVQNTIRELESSSNDSLAILGPRVSQVHKMVRNGVCDNGMRSSFRGFGLNQRLTTRFFSFTGPTRDPKTSLQGTRCWSDWFLYQDCARQGRLCTDCRVCDWNWNLGSFHCHERSRPQDAPRHSQEGWLSTGLRNLSNAPGCSFQRP